MELAWIEEQIPIIKRVVQYQQLDFCDKTKHSLPPTHKQNKPKNPNKPHWQ